MVPGGKTIIWLTWGVLVICLTGVLGHELFIQEQKPTFLIGQTSHGHHQIEMACTTCHTQAFGGQELLQTACMGCHETELDIAQDSHPKSKFTDPRNADRLALIDARYCVSCHAEHNEDISGHMGVTRPVDLCFNCHQDIAEDRPSHAGMGFETCASSGCHNFHDNRALYEDFLAANAGGPWLKPDGTLPSSELSAWLDATGVIPLSPVEYQLPPELSLAVSGIENEWENSPHALAGVGCNTCHGPSQNWTDTPGPDLCSDCHDAQSATFMQGKHGMRLSANQSPMQPALSVLNHNTLAFAPDSLERQLTCNSCHGAHETSTLTAGAEACLGCHADEHSLAFRSSPHGQLWRDAEAGVTDRSKAVSCAGCHMPVTSVAHDQGRYLLVTHNQNDNLRPNEKMIRSVCMHCHSLEFSIDALADKKLIRNNFSGRPDTHIRSTDMALDRVR